MLIRHLPRTFRTLILVAGMAMLTVASAMERYEQRSQAVQAANPSGCPDAARDPRLDLAFLPG